MKSKVKVMDGALAVVLVIAVVFLLGRTVFSGGHAPIPDVFSAGFTFEQAQAKSLETGKPVFVVASADWCPPCQQYKRGALADEDVEAAVSSSMVPAYVNVDEDPRAAELLSVTSIPMTAIIKDGEVVSRHEGVLSKRELLTLVGRYAGEADRERADAG